MPLAALPDDVLALVLRDWPGGRDVCKAWRDAADATLRTRVEPDMVRMLSAMRVRVARPPLKWCVRYDSDPHICAQTYVCAACKRACHALGSCGCHHRRFSWHRAFGGPVIAVTIVVALAMWHRTPKRT